MTTYKILRTPLLACAVAGVLALAGCSSSTKSGGSGGSGSSSAAGGGASASADPALASQLAAAKARVEALKQPPTKWLGPTTGPTLATGKSLVVIASGTSAWEERVASDAQALGKVVGWKITVLQQPSTDSTGVTTLNQAVALHPDGILTANPIDTAQSAAGNAASAGITIVGTHAAGGPGANPSLHLFADVQPDAKVVAQAFLDYAFVDSGGHPRMVVLYTSVADVPKEKGEDLIAATKACSSCTLLEGADDINALLGGGPAQQRMTAWIQKYGSSPFYGFTISDDGWNAMMPTLHSANIPVSKVKLMATDGSVTAYDRIRQGDYQIVTAPDPDQEQVYILFDELNRAFHNMPATNFQPPYYLVDKSNIDLAGGDKDVYVPLDGFAAQYKKIWGIS